LKDAIYEKANEASGFLIDGFPRRIDQGNYIENNNNKSITNEKPFFRVQ